MKTSPNITRWKFKKLHKPNYKFTSLVERKFFIQLASPYAIQANESGKLTFKELEACRRALRRGLGKSARILFRIFPSAPLSKKPVALRMGKGKGGIALWVAVVKTGKILIEINCLQSNKIKSVLESAATKLSIKTKILIIKF